MEKSNEISIRMLLSHTSGLPDTFEEIGSLLVSAFARRKVWTDEELVNAHDGQHYFDPGSGWRYSNANYILLGTIAEKVAGHSLGALFREMIYDPLGLDDTSYPPEDGEAELLVPGFDRSLMPYPNTHAPDQSSWASLAAGSGAMVSTSLDIANAAVRGRIDEVNARMVCAVQRI